MRIARGCTRSQWDAAAVTSIFDDARRHIMVARSKSTSWTRKSIPLWRRLYTSGTSRSSINVHTSDQDPRTSRDGQPPCEPEAERNTATGTYFYHHQLQQRANMFKQKFPKPDSEEIAKHTGHLRRALSSGMAWLK
uniref:Uncharacterized protein n=1 Tax=Noctiluca scintillans TaxID=2966 RepID=A0A7S1ACM1_NOCSC